MQVRRIRPNEPKLSKKGKPAVIFWKGVRMVANHSIRSVAREIVSMSHNQDFVAINFIGKQGTGKTELMKTLAHLIHEGTKLNYNINYFGRAQMLDLEETVKSLTPTNQIIIMDDIAFLNATATSQQIHQIENVMGVIRHLPGGKDVKIILMKSFQYSKSLPPFLRQNDATFISSVDDNEIENLETLLGKKYHHKINDLKRMRVEAKISDEKDNSYFTYKLGTRGEKVTYKSREPFLPFLYSNQISCRVIVSPLRTWIKPICHICSPVQTSSPESIKSLEVFMADFVPKFGGEANAKAAVKIKLIQQGINCYSPRIVQGVRYIEQFLDMKAFSLEDLATAFELVPTNTHLNPPKQPSIKTEITV